MSEQIPNEQIESTINVVAAEIVNEPEFNITLFDLVQLQGNPTDALTECQINIAIEYQASHPKCNINTLLAIIEMANHIQGY